MRRFRAVVIGASSGGLSALETVLASLPKDFSVPVAVVQHLSPDSDGTFAEILARKTQLKVKEAEDKESLEANMIYIAPPNYHFLIEHDETVSLSVDEKENYSRPSIDVLFESAADTFGSSLVGIILTGASSDGARGLKAISQKGGFTIAQEPSTAEAKTMPEAAIRLQAPDQILPLNKIGLFLKSLCEESKKRNR